MTVRPVAGPSPDFRLEAYFAGRTQGSGVFLDRFGRLRRQFQIDAEGRFDGETLTLAERITYDDGQIEPRTWRLRPVGEHAYDATTDDLVGLARGRVQGSEFALDYRIALDLGGRRVVVRFDDRMFLQPNGLLINRANVFKFGILIGQVTCVFRQLASLDECGDAQAA
jgi:Protein of unknown function (DUF3833)